MKKKLLLAATLAAAAQTVLAANGQPYYGLQGMYFDPDNSRGNEDGFGGALLLGAPVNPYFATELNLYGLRSDNQVGQGFDKQWGGGLDLLAFPFTRSGKFAPFLMIGSGAGYDDRSVRQGTHTFAKAGGGFLYDISSDGLVALRVDANRVRAHDDDVVPGRDKLWDTRVNAGLQIAFGADPVPVVAVPPPPPPPPAPPVGDADGDGVPDDKDQCPGTPPGSLVNNVGCTPPPPAAPVAVTDSDQDGVPDAVDACPGTPFGFKVDERGCAIKAAKIVLRDINFEFNSSNLTSGAKASLAKVADGLRGQPTMNLAIEGHTDAVGADAYNLKLSKQRSAAAKAYLVENGIEASRLETSGFGESQPVASNKTKDGRAENRRVEFKVTQQ